jgi:hypothetical protein
MTSIRLIIIHQLLMGASCQIAAQLDEQLGQPASVVFGLANGWLQVEPSGPAAAQ